MSRSAAARRPSRRPLRFAPSRNAMRRAVKPVAVVVGALLLIGGPIHLRRVGAPEFLSELAGAAKRSAIAATAELGLAVDEVFVEGREETDAGTLLAALGVRRGSPVLAFDPYAAKAAIEALPWVAAAAVERRLPAAVYVRIVERKPLALWQSHGRLALIDREGVEIAGADLARFAHLPTLVGDDAPRHAASLGAMLAAEPTIERRVVAAVRVGGRRWNLLIDAGEGRTVEVRLPEINPGAAYMRLAELVRDDALLRRDVAGVDLRLPDRLVFRPQRQTPPVADPPAKPARSDRRA